MNFICEFCGRKSRAEHSYQNHIAICKANPNFGLKGEFKRNGLSEKDKRLLAHYRHLYPELYKDLYSKIVPEYKLDYGAYGAIKLGKELILKKLIEVDEPIQIANHVWECPICHLHIKDMGAHIEKVHNMQWDAFCIEYSWNNPRIFCDENHRENLSKNKKYYYNETEAGIKRRKQQSIANSGLNNPACRDDVKLKISRSRKGKSFLSKQSRYNISKSTNNGIYSSNARSYGYTFWAICNNTERRFRSKLEYEIFLMLDYYKIPFEYEPYKLEYYDSDKNELRHYIIDYIINNRIFEVKPSYIQLSIDPKYGHISKKLKEMNKELELLTLNNFYDILNIHINNQKPLSYFDDLILQNIREGNCKLQLPIMHEAEFYLNSKFMRSLGENPKEILEKGELIYENKKNN